MALLSMHLVAVNFCLLSCLIDCGHFALVLLIRRSEYAGDDRLAGRQQKGRNRNEFIEWWCTENN